MAVRDLLNESSALMCLELFIDTTQIPQDDVLSCEFKYNFFETPIYGKVVIRDSFDLDNFKDLKFNGSANLTIKATDNKQTIFFQTFSIVDMKVENEFKKTKHLAFYLVDVFTYSLSKKFLTKSFNSTVTSAFNDCVETDLNLLQKDKKTFNVENSQKEEQFAIPFNTSVYEFFKQRFRYSNIRMFYDHNNFNVKELDLSKCKIREELFTDRTTNKWYYYRIHQYKRKQPSKGQIILPQNVVRVHGKNIEEEQVNLKEFISKITLNDNGDEFLSMQTSQGDISNPSSEPLGAQLFDLTQNLLETNQLTIFVTGLFTNDIGTIMNVHLDTKSPFAENQINGDVSSSGKFLVTEIVDKFIGTKFIQRITLSRFDNPKTY